MSPTARQVARLAGELDSVARRLKNLIPLFQILDGESRALRTAKNPEPVSFIKGWLETKPDQHTVVAVHKLIARYRMDMEIGETEEIIKP
jgi:hypothetical protein